MSFVSGQARVFVSTNEDHWKELAVKSAEVNCSPSLEDISAVWNGDDSEVATAYDLNGFTLSGTFRFKADDSNAVFFDHLFEFADAARRKHVMDIVRAAASRRITLTSLFPEDN